MHALRERTLPCSERLARWLPSIESGTDPKTNGAAREELARKRLRVLDFVVTPGRASAKIQGDEQRPLRTVVTIPQFSDEQWERISNRMSERAIYLAKLFAGELPLGIDDAFTAEEIELLPSSPHGIRSACDCGVEHCGHVEALVAKLGEALDADPFLVFAIRGRGREELLMSIGKHRAARKELLRQTPEEAPPESPADAPRTYENPIPTGPDFWKAGPEIFQLSYSIRADELPAAILRHLDPIPLGAFEDSIEMVFDDIYAQVARRAQAFGLAWTRARR